MSEKESLTEYLGHHVLAEYRDCSLDVLNNQELLQSSMEEAAELAGATIVKSVFHQFSPMGISGVVVIQESHFAIHSWPEHNYAAVDLFTCNTGMDFMKAYNYLVKIFGSKDHDYKVHKRGVLNLESLKNH